MRFPVRISCFFSWNSQEAGVSFGAGWTSDLSSDGICLCADQAPKPGDVISVEVVLPACQGSSLFRHAAVMRPAHDAITAYGEGRVVWTDARSSRFAANVCFQLYGPSLSSESALPA